MNIFIVHSGRDFDDVKAIKEKLYKDEDGVKDKSFNMHLLQYELKDNHCIDKLKWHHKAEKLIRESQMILYIVGDESAKSKNIDWELKTAKEYNKQIICYFLDEDNNPGKDGLDKNDNRVLNDPLYEKNKFSKKDTFLAECVSSLDELRKIVHFYENNEYVDLINSVFDDDNEKLFEQYKLFAKTSEDLLTRRQNVNSFYMSANAALITIIATVFSVVEGNWISKLIITIAISIPGIFMCSSWSQILESYGTINSSKMVILGIMEKKLPASLFQAEWQVMDCKYNKKPYVSFTKGESRTPKWFKGLYIAIIIICLLGIFPLLLHKVYKENIFGLKEPINILYEKLFGFIKNIYMKNL